ncbi:MAG: DUF115 domain-containing protein [Bacteroidetes bacterium]|nr:DUF115 domain-containing protein [Bacteroidota bacterium]
MSSYKNIFGTLRNIRINTLKEIRFLLWHNKNSHNLMKFHNIHYGKDCFIIGNGPSLNLFDLNLLNDYYTFGLNRIYLIFDKINLNLSYYVSTNPLVVEQNKSDLGKIKCPQFLPHHSIRSLKNNINNNFLFMSSNYKFNGDITSGVHHGYTVTFVALQIAFYMGFKNVFLVGVDHKFNQTGNPGEKQFLNENDTNHFDANYFKGQDWHLADLDNSEISYLMARKAYEKHGRKIFDATVNGNLKIFEKIPFDESITLAKKLA